MGFPYNGDVGVFCRVELTGRKKCLSQFLCPAVLSFTMVIFLWSPTLVGSKTWRCPAVWENSLEGKICRKESLIKLFFLFIDPAQQISITPAITSTARYIGFPDA
ncbi:Hypothetical predicted protein [Podarcis lilfordi]|uniref:Uncharacterized protein n=1 Tax=Podarcis lilfordi TaxID=74358 RepID=A0AA35L0L9_9SAUR|nr:Hypothetical predicted protein [Podarcis lilfordi]